MDRVDQEHGGSEGEAAGDLAAVAGHLVGN
jgi:hypothetical protein